MGRSPMNVRTPLYLARKELTPHGTGALDDPHMYNGQEENGPDALGERQSAGACPRGRWNDQCGRGHDVLMLLYC